MCGEPINIDHDIDDRDPSHLMHVLLKKWAFRIMDRLLELYRRVIFFHTYLALYDLIQFLESRFLCDSFILFTFALNNVVHSVKVFKQPCLMLHH